VAERIVTVGLVLALVASVGQTIVGLVNGLVFDGRYIQLDLDREFNVFAWASSAATFAAAFAALLAAVALEEGRARWATFATILAFFSADDLLVLHERLTRRLREFKESVSGLALDPAEVKAEERERQS